jgi:hypothetical protein
MSSCSVQKRYHRKGYTITWKKNVKVKIHSQNKKLIVEKLEGKSKIVSYKSKSDSTNRIFENNGDISNESQTEPKRGGMISRDRKETKSLISTFNLPKKLYTSHYSRIKGKTFKKEIIISAKTQPQKSELKVKSISKFKKPNYFEGARILFKAGVISLLTGLILYLIGGVLELSGFALASSIFLISATVVWVIAGILLYIAIFSALICLITFGMVC